MLFGLLASNITYARILVSVVITIKVNDDVALYGVSGGKSSYYSPGPFR